MKKNTEFFCSNCGYSSLKWLGKCPSCGQYNTFYEEEIIEKKQEDSYRKFQESKISSLTDIKINDEQRLVTGIEEFDRVLGGGIVKGSLVLMGGEPGAGKSTLALTVAGKVADQGNKTLYFSAEESEAQIKLRANRLNINSKNLFLIIETGVEKIVNIIEKENPGLVIIDSIQTVYKETMDSLAGSVNQVRESCAQILYTAKKLNIPIFIIGHITKEGLIAGPKILEHMVDTVLYFEAEKYHQFKILRSVKNRFGSVNEIGIFEMTSFGLLEIKSPSKIFLDNIQKEKAGSGIVTIMEGTRPLLLEIQALTSRRNFGVPQRTVIGVDYNRFLIIVAILERKLNLHLENQDIFVNVSGGIRIFETAADLGIAAAIYSSFKNIKIPTDLIFIGELGLDGEIRPVNLMDARISEAEKLGFKKCIIPEKTKIKNTKLDIIKIKNIIEISNIIKKGGE